MDGDGQTGVRGLVLLLHRSWLGTLRDAFIVGETIVPQSSTSPILNTMTDISQTSSMGRLIQVHHPFLRQRYLHLDRRDYSNGQIDYLQTPHPQNHLPIPHTPISIKKLDHRHLHRSPHAPEQQLLSLLHGASVAPRVHGGGGATVGFGTTTTTTVAVMVAVTVLVDAGAVEVTRVVLAVRPRQEQALERREAG